MASSKKHERICAICKNTYNYCPVCDEYQHMEPWHLRWCSKSCMEVDSLLSSWGAHQISSAEAAEQLKTHDLSRMEYWNDNYKAAYNQIMAEANGAPEGENFLDKFKAVEAEAVADKEADHAPDPVEAAVEALGKALDAEDEAKAEEKKAEEFKKPQQKYHNKKK